ncbi:MAG: hypothetical protein MAG715_01024 [Methanonatronarchaeales archaeon]|nr:hypothetical protein [Methanonatronarchaeales archaeon]
MRKLPPVIATLTLVALLLASTQPSSAILGIEDLPPTHQEKFADDWWDVDSEPEFDAEVMQSEIGPGKPQQIHVLLTNVGQTTGFDSVNDPASGGAHVTSDPVNDTKAAGKELGYDQEGTTAKNLVATLEGKGPIEVDTRTASSPSPVISGASAQLPFTVTVDEDAESGTYELNLTLSYNYLQDAAVFYDSGNFVPYRYHRRTETTIPVKVTVEENPVFEVIDVEVAEGELRLSRESTVAVTYRNIGQDTAYRAESSLTTKPPFSTQGTVRPSGGASADTTFLGDLAPGEEATATYELSVSRDGLAKNYSLKSRVSFEDSGGNTETSRALKTVLSVRPFEKQFRVVDAELGSELTPGGESALTVTFENTGDRPANDAVGRISVADPFTSTSDTAYLGDIEPGSTATARFRLSAAGDAMPKRYGVDSEVKYRDENGRTKLSDNMKAEVQVGETSGGPLGAPGLTAASAAAALALLALLARRR